MIEKSTHGGKRVGAGRKEGSVNKVNLEKAAVKRAYQQRVMRHADLLLNAQLSLAQGLSFLFRIEKDEKGHNKRPERVTAPGEIEAYLAGDYENGSDYYYITAQDPDNRTIADMLDRTFGKPEQGVDITSGGAPIQFGNIVSRPTDDDEA